MSSIKKFVHVFVGCCSSAFIMEILMTKMPECATFITFLQFLFITVQGFVVTTKLGKVSFPNLFCILTYTSTQQKVTGCYIIVYLI